MILTNELAAYMKSQALQALVQAHESTIKPEQFFVVVREVTRLIAAVECTVAMTSMMDMIQAGLEPPQMLEGLTSAATTASTDSHIEFKKLADRMRLVAITLAERTIN